MHARTPILGRYLDAVGGPWDEGVQESLCDIKDGDVLEVGVGVRAYLLVSVESGAMNNR
jgi:hypothetical protein